VTLDPIAIRFVTDGFSTGGSRLMGRQSAGRGFLRAFAAQKPDRVFCYSKIQTEAEVLQRELALSGAASTKVDWIPWLAHRRLTEAGLLYNPDPNLTSLAWYRAQYDTRSYSLCGIVHTVLSHRANENLAELPLVPLEPWDAVICTSMAVRNAVSEVIEAQYEILARRVGATRRTLPELPVIPLGVHCADYEFSEQDKTAARLALGIEQDEVVVLFVGRLAYHAKAHPVPMYLALREAARGKKVVLLQAGWFANKAIEELYQREMAQLCRGLKYRVVDGRVPHMLRAAWAAADIFTSLSDNFQETFGLTPIEAMACGIPSVVSDWNGYRDTVRHGIDGYRIPSLTLPTGSAQFLTDMYDAEIASYDQFCAFSSALVAIDVPATKEAYERLICAPELRKKMGQSARKRAEQEFDWMVIMKRYVELWGELQRLRRAEGSVRSKFRRPDHMNPFTMYQSYSSAVIGPSTIFDVSSDAFAEGSALLELDSIKKSVAQLVNKQALNAILTYLAKRKTVSFGELRRAVPEWQDELVARTTILLCKIGIIGFRANVREND
jgi:glycosyltransferase involved in cell wall biosynthesis